MEKEERGNGKERGTINECEEKEEKEKQII